MWVLVWVVLQIVVPLRHHLYPGNPNWTEEGHRFAWHMKLRDKSAVASFLVTDTETGEQWLVDPQQELTEWQSRKMSGRPDMILDYAHHLARTMARPGARDRITVHATVSCSLNGRPPQFLIDPEVDLAHEPRSMAPAPWIVPLAPRDSNSDG
jgi:vitamin K-dependent gamma-carboxylase